jgi:hypothetical protein
VEEARRIAAGVADHRSCCGIAVQDSTTWRCCCPELGKLVARVYAEAGESRMRIVYATRARGPRCEEKKNGVSE